MTLVAETKLGPYEIAALLGAGGMGEVYRARDPRIGRDVAIKVIHSSFNGDSERLGRFEQEVRAAGALNHPNILSIYDVGTSNGSPYLVSELLEGETLRDRLNAGPLPLKKAIDFAMQIAQGLAAAHDKGIIHRDLKPENLFITRDGRVKILDFGLAKLTRPEIVSGARQSNIETTPGTQTGMVLGTVGYMSPEQVRGEKADHRSDIFSFGAILYEILSGKRAFDGETAVEKMNAILKNDPASFPGSSTAVPMQLRWLLDRCLAKDAAERYAATTDLFHDLKTMLAHASEISGAAVVTAAPVRARNRKQWLLLPLGLMLAAAAYLTGARLNRSPGLDLSKLKCSLVAGGPEAEEAAAWSPDGKSIVYSAVAKGTRQIFIRKFDSDAAAQITYEKNDCLWPVWSDEGDRIYYYSEIGPNVFDYFSVLATGGASNRVLHEVNAATPVSGQKGLLFVTPRDHLRSVWMIAAPGAPEKELFLLPVKRDVFDTALFLSPDSKKLAIKIRHKGANDLWIVQYPSGKPLWKIAGCAALASWFPDSRRIAFDTDYFQVAVVDLKTKESYAITQEPTKAAWPSVSPDGKRILFTMMQVNLDVMEVSLSPPTVRPFVAGEWHEWDGTWAPDGKVIYISDRTGFQTLWLRDPLTGSEKPVLTSNDLGAVMFGGLQNPAFSPDGHRIALQGNTVEGPRIWTLSLDGVAVPLFSDTHLTQRSASWSPNGEWIGFIGGMTPFLKLYKTRGGDPPVLLADDVAGRIALWSPEGTWIAFQSNHGLEVISPETKERRLLSKSNWKNFGWSADAKKLVGIVASPQNQMWLTSIDLISGRENPLMDLGTTWQFQGSFSPSRDGRSFLTTLNQEKSDIWMLEGFEPRTNWTTPIESP